MVSQEQGAEAPPWGITAGGRRKALVTCGFSGLNSSEGMCRAVKGLARPVTAPPVTAAGA